jgi:hypothetical protein
MGTGCQHHALPPSFPPSLLPSFSPSLLPPNSSVVIFPAGCCNIIGIATSHLATSISITLWPGLTCFELTKSASISAGLGCPSSLTLTNKITGGDDAPDEKMPPILRWKFLLLRARPRRHSAKMPPSLSSPSRPPPPKEAPQSLIPLTPLLSRSCCPTENHQPFNLWSVAAPNDCGFRRQGFDEGVDDREAPLRQCTDNAPFGRRVRP